jgi:hypothetical protein
MNTPQFDSGEPLAPCPFCGHSEHESSLDGTGWIRVHCEYCGASGPYDADFRGVWNKQAARAAPAQPEDRVLLRRGTNLGSMGVGTSPWMQVFHQHDTYNDAEFAWATIERIK